MELQEMWRKGTTHEKSAYIEVCNFCKFYGCGLSVVRKIRDLFLIIKWWRILSFMLWIYTHEHIWKKQAVCSHVCEIEKKQVVGVWLLVTLISSLDSSIIITYFTLIPYMYALCTKLMLFLYYLEHSQITGKVQ